MGLFMYNGNMLEIQLGVNRFLGLPGNFFGQETILIFWLGVNDLYQDDEKSLIYENLLVMRRLNKMFEEGLAEASKAIGLTFPQSFILHMIHNNEGIMPSEIARIGSWHLSTVTSLLSGLLRKELIYLKALKKGKGSQVFLSRKGKSFGNKSFTISSGKLKNFVDEIGSENLKYYLEIIYDMFSKVDGGEYEKVIRRHMLGVNQNI